MPEEVHLSIPSLPKYLCVLRSVVERVLGAMDFTETDRMRTVLALDEAATNIIRHSCGCDPDITIDITFKISDDELVMEVRDFGECGKEFVLDDAPDKEVSDLTPGGLGVGIIKSVMDHVEYTTCPEKGNILRMYKKVAVCTVKPS